LASAASAALSDFRRAASTKVEVMAAVTTVMKPNRRQHHDRADAVRDEITLTP
jgi:hypothetical protein